MKFYSPLRYPGGKNKLAKFISLICEKNNINGHYVEPYAGGASVALYLLFNKYVNKITINDIDRSIYAFWYSVLNNVERLCKLIKETKVNLKTREKCKKIQLNKGKADLLELGFSTFFLNRVNVSGILNGGPIGGEKQKGDYKINCRFNKLDLINRIKNIAKLKNKISLYNLDALDLIRKIQAESKSKKTIFYFDPPYYFKGDSLYTNFYKDEDHELLRDEIKKIKNFHWIVSYDDVPRIRNLYKSFNSKKYSFYHTANNPKVGKEILFFDSKLIVPEGNPVKI